MPLFQRENLKILFVHIPKTGGTSMERWLSKKMSMSFFSPIAPTALKICPQHLQIGDLRLLFGK